MKNKRISKLLFPEMDGASFDFNIMLEHKRQGAMAMGRVKDELITDDIFKILKALQDVDGDTSAVESLINVILLNYTEEGVQ